MKSKSLEINWLKWPKSCKLRINSKQYFHNFEYRAWYKFTNIQIYREMDSPRFYVTVTKRGHSHCITPITCIEQASVSNFQKYFHCSFFCVIVIFKLKYPAFQAESPLILYTCICSNNVIFHPFHVMLVLPEPGQN